LEFLNKLLKIIIIAFDIKIHTQEITQHNFKTIMNKYTLKFLDKPLEMKYQSEAEHEKVQRLCSLVKMELCLSFICTGYTVVIRHTMADILSVLCVLIVLCVLFLIRRFVPKLLKTLLILVFFGFTILFTELIAQFNANGLYSGTTLVLIIPLQLFIYAVLLTKVSWLFCFCFYIWANFYLMLRVFNFNDNPMKYYLFLGLLLAVISFGVMSYKQEQTFRQFYKSIHESNQSLSHFKILVQNIMPNPIFIVNYLQNKIEFYNKSAFEMSPLKKPLKSHHVRSPISIQPKNCSCAPITIIDKAQNDIIDLFPNYEQLLNCYQITENPTEIELPLSETLFTYYCNNEVQNMGNCDLIKKEQMNIKFLTLNIVSLDPPKNINDTEKQEKHYFDLKIAKICWERQPCLLVLFNDNTSLRKVIELQNLDEYKNRLLATVSHDLRTPLNGLLGILEVVTPQISDPEVKKNLIIGQRSANLLLYMINDFLDFSQIIYKKIRLNLEFVKIHEIISETVELVEFQVRKKNLHFIVDLKNIKDDLKIQTDGNRIKQILLNLLSNSLKFTQHGFIKLSVKVMPSDKSSQAQTIKFSVKDSGIGIKEIDRPKLFRLFSKLDQADQEMNKTGVGLGLTISQSLVKLLDGNESRGITMKSESGKGSKFWFFINSKEEEEENVFSRPENLKIKIPFIKSYSNNSTTSLNYFPTEKDVLVNTINCRNIKSFQMMNKKEKKILIADDDLINLMIIQKYLEFYGLNYLTANDGEEAFEKVKNDIMTQENSIILILMDCNMPILDGFQSSKKILKFIRDEGLNEIPIIAVTANVEVADQEKCYQAGMKKFLTKPVKRKDLGVVLQSYLKINFGDGEECLFN